MAAWRRPGIIDRFRTKLLEGMRKKNFTAAFAEHVFNQIRGFGEYGFPESHAASFALLVYASCYLKCHYPDAFCVALLNSQPMGFYAPAQLISDAKKHGVEVHGVDINLSDWMSTLEPNTEPEDGQKCSNAIRLGLTTIRGLSSKIAQQIIYERQLRGSYSSMEELVARTGLGKTSLATLADADAFESLQVDRRAAIWHSLGQDHTPNEQPLFADLDESEQTPSTLVPMTPMEEVHADYNMTGLSLKAHPISFVRNELLAQRCVTAKELDDLRSGRHVRVAGLILLRQKPSTAKGIVFATMEDETGSINLVIFKAVWERFFRVARTSNAWLVDGKLENRQGVIHVIVGRITDLSQEVTGLSVSSRDFH